MFTFRCTRQLLDRIGTEHDPAPSPPDNVLGDWYAHLVRAGRTQVVLAVSERTLLPVVMPARQARTGAQRLTEALAPMLASIGVPGEDITTECGAMQVWAIGKTANRRVLGSLNELAFQLQGGLLDAPERTLLGQSLWLAGTPMKLIEYGSPDRATVAAFEAHRALRRLSRR